MKKIRNLILGCLCVLSLVSCGDKPADDVSTPTPTPTSSTPGAETKETWTVTLDYNYDDKGAFKTFEVERDRYGVKLTNQLDEKPTRDGHKFEAWYIDTACKVAFNIAKDFIYADTTLYANWIKEVVEEKKTAITWNTDVSFTYEAVGAASLPASVKEGSKVSFKIKVNEEYEGTPVVKVNETTLTAEADVYSFVAEGASMAVSVSGLTKKQQQEINHDLNIYYTIPTWDPVVTNPKLYYWGTDASGNFMDRAIEWDNAEDTQGSMELISGNDYKATINFEDGMEITGIIVVMYQNGVKKQSQDIVTSITAAGEYDITFVNEWVNDKFSATISQRG